MQDLFLIVKLLFLIVILFIGKGQSLKCYVCRSDVNEGCSNKDNMNSTLSTECPPRNSSSSSDSSSSNSSTPVYCRKIHQKLKFKNEKSFTSIRECAYERTSSSSGCYRYKWLENAYQEVCECDSENCNGGSAHVPEIFTVALAFALRRILNYLIRNNT